MSKALMKHWRVYVVSDDSYCSGVLEFEAEVATLLNERILLIDGKKFISSDGFCDLREGYIN